MTAPGVAVVTGAAGGLGLGIAQALAARGWRVMLSDVAAERLEAAVAELRRTGADVAGLAADVRDPAAMQALADATATTFGPTTLLVNNAGVEALGYSWEIPAETWQRTIDCNLLGAVNGIRAFVPGMTAAGVPARIANVASIAALGTMPLAGPYMASKHALLALSEGLKLEMELKRLPIAVSVILPGAVATRIMDGAAEGSADPLVAAHHAVMTGMLAAHGLTPEAAGDSIVDQLLAGRFRIATDAATTDRMAAERAAYLCGGEAPELSDEQRALLPGID